MINDANIIPIDRVPAYTRAIKIGNRVFPLAVYTGTSGGTSFYKCASVNTSTKTWTGNKAILTNGVYSFEETTTEGLSYSAVTPKVGAVYSADALGEVKLWTGAGNIPAGVPTDGLLAWYPLTVNANDAFGGRSDSIINGNVDFSKGYATGFSTSNYIQLPGGIIPNGQNEWTVGFVIKKPERTWCHDLAEVKGSNEGVAFNDQSGWYHIQYWDSEWTAVNEQPFDKWLLLLIANKPSTGHMVVYTNGSETRATDSREISINNPITVGVLNRNGNIENATPSVTQIKHIFFYGKALSSDEVSSMYQAMSNAGEFNDSPVPDNPDPDNPDPGDKSYAYTVTTTSTQYADAAGDYYEISGAELDAMYPQDNYPLANGTGPYYTNGRPYCLYYDKDTRTCFLKCYFSVPEYTGWETVSTTWADGVNLPATGEWTEGFDVVAHSGGGGTPVFKVSGATRNPEINGDYNVVTPASVDSTWDTSKPIYSNGAVYFAYTSKYWNGWTVVADVSTGIEDDAGNFLQIDYCMGAGSDPWDVDNGMGGYSNNSLEFTLY